MIHPCGPQGCYWSFIQRTANIACYLTSVLSLSSITKAKGSVDPEDGTLLATAIRETHEEMGILPDDIEYLGDLDDMPTISHFLINAFVATIPYPYDFKPSEFEVAEVLEVPISHLRREASVRWESRLRDGIVRTSPTYVYDGHVIFGATAMVLGNFLDILGDAPI